MDQDLAGSDKCSGVGGCGFNCAGNRTTGFTTSAKTTCKLNKVSATDQSLDQGFLLARETSFSLGEGLTPEDKKKCVWARLELVARIEFLEWTDADHRRHSKFTGMREDKDPRSIVIAFVAATWLTRKTSKHTSTSPGGSRGTPGHWLCLSGLLSCDNE